jgi:putative DNA methylase
MAQPKKLIEVAMPIKEISAESVRDKSIRHGHISTLHLWWARRPLPVCRAVVFASLVPDPLDPNCPQAFKDAVELLLGKANNIGDPYAPYADIPWTSIYDPMEDNLRNRLQMFIGKFTDPMQQHLLGRGAKPQAGKMLTDKSLIKWDSKNDEIIIGKARKLIWVAHNSKEKNKISAKELIADFDKHYKSIKDAELELYAFENRHLKNEIVSYLEEKLEHAKESFLDKMPKVFDPFAGGGAIPLEAARLGCRSYGNDINPVAHIIQKGSLEFPQKYGKPITYAKEEFISLYGEEELLKWCQQNGLHIDAPNLKIEIPNRLSFDVEFYAKKLLCDTEKEIGYLYPADEKGNKPIAYYWAYEATCSNPSCRAKIPLVKQFYLVNKPDKKVHLKPNVKGYKISFEIKQGEIKEETWIKRKNLKCPVCSNITDIKELKRQFIAKEPSKKLIAVVEEGINSKAYRLPTIKEIEVVNSIPQIQNKPLEKMPKGNSRDLHCMGWGVDLWSDMFTERQLLLMSILIKKLDEFKIYTNELQDKQYRSGLLIYQSIFIDRIAAANTAFGRLNVARETLETPFSRQAIPFMLDFPESNPFSSSTGSALNQLDWITRYIESECVFPFSVTLNNASSGDENQFESKFLDAVVTDPPYYDAIAYADLSDFFYTWLKRMIGDEFRLNFAVPQTPKTEECTALKHHHAGDMNKARIHFEKKLQQIFGAIEKQTKDVVSIMFAHQSTEAWTTLCNSILGARMNITGSWTIDTEMSARMVAMDNAALQSSVTVSCVPTQSEGYGDYKEVKKAIETTVAREVDELYKLGFRGADLLTACFGQAVSEFGKYKKVEKADGSEVTVAELLEMARESAFNALLKGFDGDEFTKFYIGWLQLNGFSESDFDDAAKFVKVGLSINVQELFTEHILIKNGNKQTLGNCAERIAANKNIGDKPGSYLIDQVHKAMHLFKGTNRGTLLKFISEKADAPDNAFWRVVTSLDELLPKDSEDQKLTRGLISNKDSLIRDSKESSINKLTQGALEL